MATPTVRRGVKYKSKFEARVAEELFRLKLPIKYESEKIKYTIPEEEHTYTPDFPIGPIVYLEAKGKFTPADRKKHILLKKQHPEKEIWIVLMGPNNKLSKKSKTTYASWCEKNGLRWTSLDKIKDLKLELFLHH